MFDPPKPPTADERRSTFFASLTGSDFSEVSGKSSDVQGMLRTVFAKPDGRVDTRAAARELGVSQRTIQRWMKGTQAPKGPNLTRLRNRSKREASTKAGRRHAVQRQKRSPLAQKGAKITIRGHQGVPGANVLGQSYQRFRNATLQLTPQEFQDLLDAYAEGGDSGLQSYLEAEYSQKYGAGTWELNYISNIDFSEI